MYQKSLIMLALLLMAAGGGLASAQNARKAIRSLSGEHGVIFPYPITMLPQPYFCLNWSPPTKTPLAESRSYRVDWSLRTSGFRSYRQENTRRAGHVYVDSGNVCWDIRATRSRMGEMVDWDIGATLRIRLRARYAGRNGPWTNLSVTRNANGFTSSDITITVAPRPTEVWTP